mgnify:CR=1 FL=1
MQAVFDRIDELPKPALIALTIIGFVLFWPIGLAILVIYFRGRGTIAVDDINQMKG